ncbi:hypothetical protein C922_05634 [Plasmodium inui San Antonio 1]|uniref:Uncharacterized protein n=1 Tax=Plasmodium inui San Antonio 1 TaxID=1237626 RepID=W6ZST1_9APIC|nr:hypothetical protein C922_05634 [Plasmodium inui San Antonio 1]EUD63982.1 hypothetical protein C922_05634 [Plasmodium inui San Antonio 1]
MSPKEEITNTSTRKPRKPRNSQKKNRAPKLTANELSSMMCIQVTKEGIRLKKPKIKFPFPMWLDPKKGERISDPREKDRISPSKVSEDNCQEQIKTKKSNEAFNSPDAKNLKNSGYCL